MDQDVSESFKFLLGSSLEVSLTGPPFSINAMRTVYSAFSQQAAGSHTAGDGLHLAVERAPGSTDAWTLDVDGQRLMHGERFSQLAPYLEIICCQFATQYRDDRFAFHASGVAREGQAVLMPGVKGSGKSTLAVWLSRQGYQYLGDEIIWVEPEAGRVEAFPKAAAIKAGSFNLFENVDEHESATRGSLRYVLPSDHAQPGHAPLPVSVILFPVFEKGARQRIFELSPEETVLNLAPCIFGGLGKHPERMAALQALSRIPSYLMMYDDCRAVGDFLGKAAKGAVT